MAEPAPDEANLQVGDIEAVVRIIDHAAQEGAFKGWGVLQEVFTVRNRLVTFLTTINPQSQQSEPQDDGPPESPANT